MLYGNRCRSRLAAEKAEQIMLLKSALFRNDDDVDEFAELSEIFRALTEADDDVCIMD